MVVLQLWTFSAIFGRQVEIGDVYCAFYPPDNVMPLAYVPVQRARAAFESPYKVPPAVRLQKDF